MRGKFQSPVVVFALLGLLVQAAVAAEVDTGLIGGMKWRQIGPFRGGRVVAVTGVLTAELAKWRAVFDRDLPAFQALMREHGVPLIAGP